MNGSAVPPSFLRIMLLSPAVVGVASVDPLDVDLDVTTDVLGLPYIPRHRLAARLRDAADDVAAAFPDMITALRDLLGSSRRLTGTRMLQIGHGELPRSVQAAAAHAVHSEAASTVDADLPRPMASRIRDAYTEILVSTARDEDGAPIPGTFHQIRAIRAGTAFTAPLSLSFRGEHVSADHRRAVALMCVAFEQIGTGHSRGLGQIEASLDGDLDHTRDLAFGRSQK
ncbi:hypothetical protein [Rhodococcus qingshengii]|uniref:Uncharacterized protein n=1 Tax=Rhodococcus qingshengii TaxID=334542 RepID=A0A2A5J067_RHOSG|nr:hypothetical protein [Rhodococcus qingshengii]PCK22978.1 hypothetical protein CHR55_31125 [Rhodococcus qingshengii]